MKKYVCEYCNKEFVSHHRATYYKHKQKCEADATGVYDKFPCDICGARFATTDERFRHHVKCSGKVIKKYKYEPHLKCDFENCTFRTTRHLELENHVNRHLNLPLVKNYACDKCGNCYTSPHHLKHHIKTMHLNIKDFNCEECGAKFASKQFLKRHQLIHTDIRPHICPYCTKSFKQHAVLYRHKKSCPMNNSNKEIIN